MSSLLSSLSFPQPKFYQKPLQKPNFITYHLKPQQNPNSNSSPFPLTLPQPTTLPPPPPSAGRKKNPPSSGGRIEGNYEIRRQAKLNARRRSRRMAQNLFYKRNNPKSNHPDSFSESELQAIGLGYDRMVRFLEKDDPNLKHPYDWYKYGKYGPYSWRGIVVGPPIRGRFSDERVSLISEVETHEEWEEIEQFDMMQEFSPRLESMNKEIGFRYYWVFVRHPKWRPTELPWEQWTLAAEVAMEARKEERLDKWSLMGRLGNKARAMITQCAAWMRPDIIYVKKPVYQCRFEPQDGFFNALMPLVDPETEGEYMFEVDLGDGRVEMCSYFLGLCKIVKVSPKAYVDDVVKGYERLSEEGKSKCLEFLLNNHPVELLHPYTEEWKAKLEEFELGCDAPDESDDEKEGEVVDWEEEEDEEEDSEEDDEKEESEDDDVIDVGEKESEEEEESNPEETAEYWDEQWKKAVSSADDMEKIVMKSMEVSNKIYKDQIGAEKELEERMRGSVNEGWERRREEVIVEEEGEEWENEEFSGSKRRDKKSKVPPELFLRAAVRPFTYRNLVKEIVLMRHALIDGDIKRS